MYEKTENKSQITQGDIFQKFEYIKWATEDGDDIKVDSIEIPFFVVLTQCCDLEQDFKDRNKLENEKRDKYIQSVLVCPAYIADQVRAGNHLKGLGFITETYNSKRWDIIKNNDNTRYHFLERNKELQLSDLVIDFKQYYTIPTDILYGIYKKHYVGALKPLFREKLSQRFAFYLSRIGLPAIKVEESKKEGQCPIGIVRENSR
ncbi:hypothetical protein KY366_05800 [Candidatus Woesearchaeota archaeon]|nr:hypothetical protein [Candidatus Woesearchaeota archaeon]